MSLPTVAIVNQVVSHALTLGVFDTVNAHEPKSAPLSGLACGVWADQYTPYQAGSGLTASTGRLTLHVRVYQNFILEPQDLIDVRVVDAVDQLMTALVGDFELGGNVRNVDVLGESGTALGWRAGYLNQDGRAYRVVTLSVPLVVNDLYTYTP